ncbi:ATP-binding protein [Sphaerimonospora cavernae]|uniref:ATP-binding protein n=1 Tax=Sphaerimonospora cavernae TaxID=1740611 RepID=A0ABV6TWZ2_9ACTN
MDIEFSLAMPRDAIGIPVVRRVVGDALRSLGVTEECVADILLATSEACANAVRHGGPATRYDITGIIGNGRCELRVTDRGHGLDGVPRQLPPSDAEHGRGILIMRAVVDDISFDISPGRGTTVRLCKELDWDDGAIARHLTLDRHLAGV